MKHNWKTVREWLSQLPEPYKSQSIYNTAVDVTADGYDLEDELEAKEPTIIDALEGGFVWMSSPEGDDYWRALATALENDKIN